MDEERCPVEGCNRVMVRDTYDGGAAGKIEGPLKCPVHGVPL